MAGMRPVVQPVSLEELDAAFRSHEYVEVRRRIFRQLIESLIYEGLVTPEIEAGRDGLLLFRLRGYDDAGRPVMYLCRGRKRFSFDRIRLAHEPAMRVAGTVSTEADSFSRFLLELQPVLGADPDRLVRFISELEQTLLKDALARFKGRQETRPLRTRTYDELESSLMNGHLYHPSYKSRIGFDYLDDVAYGPEFGPPVHPLWVAAHRTHTRVAASRRIAPLTFLQQELGEPVYARFVLDISHRGRRPDEYLLLPVHPWQWRECVLPTLHEALHDGSLILLGQSEVAYRPQQSIRTLANLTAPQQAYLKLALSIVNTSTSRILAPHTVQNAPLISDWLHEILQDDPFFRDELRPIFLGEILGIVFERPRPEPLQHSTYGILSCIWRESLHSYLGPGEEAVPLTALCHLDTDGRPFIQPWIEKEGPVEWTRRLLEVSLLPLIHLLYAHGIALEAHAQNVILIHSEGAPVRTAFKDFHDGIRFSQTHLAAPGSRPPLHPTPSCHARINRNSYIETDCVEDIRDFVLDAFLFANLSELALLLADHFGLEEVCFWSLVRDVIFAYQKRFAQLQDRFALFDLLASTIQIEQLTKRRLFPETEVHVQRVPNPVALSREKH